MTKTLAAITGVQGYVPDYVLTNHELEQMVDTNDEWIRTRTGIQERRILNEEGKALSDMAVPMLEGLLEKTGTKIDEIDLLICSTITGDMIMPDTANTILDKMGAKGAFGFDLNAACSGFLYGLVTGAQFIESGRYKKVIVLGADHMSTIIDYTDRSTCIIFGDGGGAVLLEPSKDNDGIQDFMLHGDGSGRHHLYIKSGGSLRPNTLETIRNREHLVFQDGRVVFKAAVNGMADTIRNIMKKNSLENKDVDWIVPHQANIRIINSVADALDFPKEKVMVNIQKFGNTTAGTLPLCLWEWENKLSKGDNLILSAFGGGYTWGSCYIKWAYDSV